MAVLEIHGISTVQATLIADIFITKLLKEFSAHTMIIKEFLLKRVMIMTTNQKADAPLELVKILRLIIGIIISLLGIFLCYGCIMGIGLGIGYLTPTTPLGSFISSP